MVEGSRGGGVLGREGPWMPGYGFSGYPLLGPLSAPTWRLQIDASNGLSAWLDPTPLPWTLFPYLSWSQALLPVGQS